MLDTLLPNLPTLALALLTLAALALAARQLRREKKAGKTCPGNCPSCSRCKK